MNINAYDYFSPTIFGLNAEKKYYLFHPYAIIRDRFTSELSVAGLIEEDYLPSKELNNKYSRPTIDSLREVIIQEDKFVPKPNWTDDLKWQSIEYLEKIDSQ